MPFMMGKGGNGGWMVAVGIRGGHFSVACAPQFVAAPSSSCFFMSHKCLLVILPLVKCHKALDAYASGDGNEERERSRELRVVLLAK